MSFGFQMTEEEEKEFNLQLKMDKEEFEALNIDYYKDFDYADFTVFISASEHKAKSYGSRYFVYEFINEESLRAWDLHKALYTLGFVEYLCERDNLELPEYVGKFQGVKMDKWLFHESVLNLLLSGYYRRALDAFNSKKAYFSKYGLAFDTVDEVIKNGAFG